jgi:CBS domain-containing protein
MRFKHLAMVDLKNSEIYLNCAEAYQSLTKIKITEGLRYDNSGQFINLEDLNKVDKENLKNALNTLKDLEELIKDSFQLTQFS